MNSIQILDCTLRDGAYVNNAKFSKKKIGEIIKQLQNAHVDIIECGWLKDLPHIQGTTYFHSPLDIKPYLLTPKQKNISYMVMIDFNRYNIQSLPPRSETPIDTIRIAFSKETINSLPPIFNHINNMGYKIFLQAVNIPSYQNSDLLKLVTTTNSLSPQCLSLADTFGALYPKDLLHILSVVNNNLNPNIKLGFHSHNNLQLSFCLSLLFLEESSKIKNRGLVIDGSLNGMGRGAGNTPLELIANFLNKEYNKHYNIDSILCAIDTCITPLKKKYNWGYTTPYFLAGIYQTHINNINYLIKKHSINNQNLKTLLENLDDETKRKYEYDLLEKQYKELFPQK